MTADQVLDEIEVVKQHVQTIRERVSRSRKEGMDTKIVELRLMNIMPKIMMAGATRQDKDLAAVSHLLSEIEEEMKQLHSENVFADTLRQVTDDERHRLANQDTKVDYSQLSQEEIVSTTNRLINEAVGHLDKKEYGKVYPLYLEIQGIYKYLPRELKQLVYKDSMTIYARLQQSQIFKPRSRLKASLAKILRFVHR